VTVRRRRLPAEEMIWLVIGIALLRDRTIVDVARSLATSGGGAPSSISSGSVAPPQRSVRSSSRFRPRRGRKTPHCPFTTARASSTINAKGFKPQKLLTSLLDARRFERDEIVALSHERWELELAYDEIETDMLDRSESIRSKSADGVEQEIWGMLLAYNLVRLHMEGVAKLAKLPPLRISFVAAPRWACSWRGG